MGEIVKVLYFQILIERYAIKKGEFCNKFVDYST